jgi:hypothetical protein
MNPVWRRFVKGECTRCGRKRDAEVWCKRCAATARRRGARNVHWPFSSDAEVRAYFDALIEELSKDPATEPEARAWMRGGNVPEMES